MERLNALEPDSQIRSEAGFIETWNPNKRQLRCVGVALSRCTLYCNGLRRPFYTNAPQEIYIQQGRGIFGMVFPGCRETYEEPQESEQGQGSRPQDRHQKVQHFKEGDMIAVPTGVVFWMYNEEETPVVAVTLIDTSNLDNQLDQMPRRFYLSGNQEQEFLQYQEQGHQGQRRQSQQGPHRGQQQEEEEQNEGGNVLSGFNDEFLEDAFNVDREIVSRLKGEKDYREGGIVKVKGGLRVITPPTKRQQQQQEEEEEQQGQQERPRSHGRRRSHHGSRGNGLEETVCTMKLHHNIGQSTSPDIYIPQAGRMKTLTSLDLPILRWLGLGAEHGSLYKNAMFVPHYNINAHSIIYVLSGRAWLQVVNCTGKAVFDGELNENQVLTVPQDFVLAAKSLSDNFSYMAFKTNDIPQIAALAGLTSSIRAMPVDVVANAYNLPREQASQLKTNNPFKYLVPPRESRMRSVA